MKAEMIEFIRGMARGCLEKTDYDIEKATEEARRGLKSDVKQNSSVCEIMKYIEEEIKLQGTVLIADVTDNSMSPAIESEDHVTIHRQEKVKNGDMACVKIGERAIIRQLSYDGEDFVELCAFNPGFPKLRYSTQEIKIIGRVVGIIKKA